MNLLVVGASYRSTPVDVLERLVVGSAELPGLLRTLLDQPAVEEAVVLSTCNRVEVWAAVGGFHAGLREIGATLATHADASTDVLARHLYAHYDDAAVAHTFTVTAGLDSMVVGEAQILGQVRAAYRAAVAHGSAGRLTHELVQHALRVGRRVRAETDIGRCGASTVTAALDVPAGHLPGGLAGRPALVVGAGAMGGIAVAALTRAGAGPIAVVGRGVEGVRRLASAYGVRPVPSADLMPALAAADVVVTATTAPDPVLTAELVAPALRRRLTRGPDVPLFVLDLAMPRDVHPAVARLDGVVVVDIGGLGAVARDGVERRDRDAAERIVAAERDALAGRIRGADAGLTVAALRRRADRTVSAELRRLAQRRPDLSEAQRAEVAHTVNRVVQQLLHPPSVRVRQLAGEPDGERYTAALRQLFDLEVPHSTPVADVPRVA
ncbi:glutamyl-tRNA reductase [Micromonospora sp. NPDC047644]|uniref:glutamyl-tRNA reductase n=1 Tax=Micromonospora sp. NPDC047644 TaxID=3157203 RepID=UPI003454F796